MINQDIIPEFLVAGGNCVLIVEKDPLQGFVLQQSLEEAGWTVRLVECPTEALSCCEYDLFDAAMINADYVDDMNGFLLAGLLDLRYNLPSLMVTAARYSELRSYVAFTPSQELLFKPYLLAECGPRLQSLIAGAPV